MIQFPFIARLAMMCTLVAACGSPYYSSAPIDGWIIDADAKQPIEGAVVVANWQLVVGSLDGERDRGQLKVMETVTDKEGHFHFDGFTKANLGLSELRSEDPRIIIFKPGYEFRKLSGFYSKAGLDTPGPHRNSEVNGQTIALKTMKPLTYGHSTLFYPGLAVELNSVLKSCGWEKTPRMIIAMDAEKKRLLASASGIINVNLVGIDDLGSFSNAECRPSAARIRSMIHE